MAFYKRLKMSQTVDVSNQDNENGDLKPPHKMYSNLMIQQLLFNEYILPTQINGEENHQTAQTCKMDVLQSPEMQSIATKSIQISTHICNVCTKAFKTKSELEIHYEGHNGEKTHVCDICLKGFTQRISLQTHYLTHTGDKPHTCNVCNKDFTDRSTLRKHTLIHTGERPHVCDVCQKSFTQKITLKKHYLTHTGEKNHTCEICNKSFAQKSTLNTHYLVHSSDRKRKYKNSCMLMLKNPKEMPFLNNTDEEKERLLLLPEVEVQLIEGIETQLIETEEQQEKIVDRQFSIEFSNEVKTENNCCLNNAKLNEATVSIDSCDENTNTIIKTIIPTEDIHNTDIDKRKLQVSGIPKVSTFDEIAKICPKAIAMTVNQSGDFRVASIKFETEEEALECFNACKDVKISEKLVTVLYPTTKEKKCIKKRSHEKGSMSHSKIIKQRLFAMNKEDAVVNVNNEISVIKKEKIDVKTET